MPTLTDGMTLVYIGIIVCVWAVVIYFIVTVPVDPNDEY